MKYYSLLLIFLLIPLAIAQLSYSDCSIYGNCKAVEKSSIIEGANYSINVNNTEYHQGLTPQQVADLYSETDPLSIHTEVDPICMPYITNGTLALNSSLSNYYLDSNPQGFINNTFNATYDSKVGSGSFNCSGSNVLQNYTINSSGAFGQCVASSSGMDYTNIAMTNKSNDFGNNNLTTTGTGFFGWLGSITSRITKLWVNDIDLNGTIQMNQGNITNATYIQSTTGNFTNLTANIHITKVINGEIYGVCTNSTGWTFEGNLSNGGICNG